MLKKDKANAVIAPIIFSVFMFPVILGWLNSWPWGWKFLTYFPLIFTCFGYMLNASRSYGMKFVMASLFFVVVGVFLSCGLFYLDEDFGPLQIEKNNYQVHLGTCLRELHMSVVVSVPEPHLGIPVVRGSDLSRMINPKRLRRCEAAEFRDSRALRDISECIVRNAGLNILKMDLLRIASTMDLSTAMCKVRFPERCEITCYPNGSGRFLKVDMMLSRGIHATLLPFEWVAKLTIFEIIWKTMNSLVSLLYSGNFFSVEWAVGKLLGKEEWRNISMWDAAQLLTILPIAWFIFQYSWGWTRFRNLWILSFGLPMVARVVVDVIGMFQQFVDDSFVLEVIRWFGIFNTLVFLYLCSDVCTPGETNVLCPVALALMALKTGMFPLITLGNIVYVVAFFIVFSKPDVDWVAMKLRFSPTMEQLDKEFNRTLESVYNFLKAFWLLIIRKPAPQVLVDELPRQPAPLQPPPPQPVLVNNNENIQRRPIVWGRRVTMLDG